MDPIGIVVWLLVAALVIWLAYFVLGLLPLPPQVKQIVCVVLAVLFLIALLTHVGAFGRVVVWP